MIFIIYANDKLSTLLLGNILSILSFYSKYQYEFLNIIGINRSGNCFSNNEGYRYPNKIGLVAKEV